MTVFDWIDRYDSDAHTNITLDRRCGICSCNLTVEANATQVQYCEEEGEPLSIETRDRLRFGCQRCGFFLELRTRGEGTRVERKEALERAWAQFCTVWAF